MHSLQFRIIGAFLAALITVFSAQGVLMWNQVGVGKNLDLVAQGYLPLSNVGTRLEQAQQRIERDVERLAAQLERPGTGPRSSAAIYTEAFSRNLREGREVIYLTRNQSLSGEERAELTLVKTHLDKIEALAERYEKQSIALVAAYEEGQKGQDQEELVTLRRTGKELAEEIKRLNLQLNNRIQNLTKETQETQTRSIAVAAGLGLVAFIFSFVLILAVSFAIRPIRSLTTQVQRLSAGDFSGQVQVRGSDEIALLATEFNKMVRALKLRDETLVQRAEELNRLSMYLTSVLDGMEESLVVCEDGRITLANQAAVSVWGAQREAGLPTALQAVLSKPGPQQLEGSDQRIHDVRTASFGDQGVLILSADVTVQVQTQKRLAQSERLALVGKMLAQITHEVRNPLNAMSLNAELLAEELEQLDPEKRTEAWSMLGTITAEIERLTDLSAHYLQLARRPRAQIESQDLSLLTKEVAHLLQPELNQHQFTLHLDCAPMEPLGLDGGQLRQALLNVIRNAVEAGATEATLSTRLNQGWVEIALADNGPGMSEEQIRQACDPFWSTKAQGTGLGLAITQQIVDEHAGRLTVASKQGKGTKVTMSLPFTPVHAHEEPYVANHSGR